jgi:hypothetical protein
MRLILAGLLAFLSPALLSGLLTRTASDINYLAIVQALLIIVPVMVRGPYAVR